MMMMMMMIMMIIMMTTTTNAVSTTHGIRILIRRRIVRSTIINTARNLGRPHAALMTANMAASAECKGCVQVIHGLIYEVTLYGRDYQPRMERLLIAGTYVSFLDIYS